MRAVDHVAYTVPDLDAAITFFVDHFGAEVIFTDGPFADGKGDAMRRRLDVDPKATCRLAMIRLGRYHNVELFEYDAPEQVQSVPRNSDVGGHHLGFYVDDIDAAIEHLRASDVRVLEGPTASRGPAEGNRWVYFLSPWGMQFELVSYPHGKAWDRQHPRAGGDR